MFGQVMAAAQAEELEKLAFVDLAAGLAYGAHRAPKKKKWEGAGRGAAGGVAGGTALWALTRAMGRRATIPGAALAGAGGAHLATRGLAKEKRKKELKKLLKEMKK